MLIPYFLEKKLPSNRNHSLVEKIVNRSHLEKGGRSMDETMVKRSLPKMYQHPQFLDGILIDKRYTKWIKGWIT